MHNCFCWSRSMKAPRGLATWGMATHAMQPMEVQAAISTDDQKELLKILEQYKGFSLFRWAMFATLFPSSCAN